MLLCVASVRFFLLLQYTKTLCTIWVLKPHIYIVTYYLLRTNIVTLIIITAHDL